MQANNQISSVVLALVIAILKSGANAQMNPKVLNRSINDPVFGISYHEAEARYEPVPVAITRICRSLGHGRFWIYAEVRRRGHQYLVVSGIPERQDGDLLGFALQIDGNHCEAEDSTWMLSGTVPSQGYSGRSESGNLPGLNATETCDKVGNCRFTLRSREEEDVLRALVQDALERGSKAWGRASRFAERACAPNLMLSNSSAPVLQSVLKTFCQARR